MDPVLASSLEFDDYLSAKTLQVAGKKALSNKGRANRHSEIEKEKIIRRRRHEEESKTDKTLTHKWNLHLPPRPQASDTHVRSPTASRVLKSVGGGGRSPPKPIWSSSAKDVDDFTFQELLYS